MYARVCAVVLTHWHWIWHSNRTEASVMLAGNRVSFLITGLARGGAENQVVNIASRLKQRGWDAHIISMLPLMEFGSELAEADIPVDCLNMRRKIPDPRGALRLIRILRRHKTGILHCHMVHANLLGRLVRPLARIPVLICTAHNMNEGGRWRELAYRITHRLADLTTSVSQAAAERYIEVGAVPGGDIAVIPPGIDTDRFRKNPSAGRRLRAELGLGEEFVWLAVGNFWTANDHPNLLSGFAETLKMREDARLLLVGEGPLKSQAQAAARRLGMSDHVRFLGRRTDVRALMNAADAYVMSSAWEGMPAVLLEASAAELPIVATDVGGNREVVDDGVSGLLVPPRNSDALADAMTRVMARSEAELGRMGKQGRARTVAHYDLELIVDRWEAIYHQFLEDKSPGALTHVRG